MRHRRLVSFVLPCAALALIACSADPPVDSVAKVICSPLGSVPGPEDLAVESRSAQRVLVSSQDRRQQPPPPGAIYAIPLPPVGHPPREPVPMRLIGRGDCSFHPHGVFADRNGLGGRLFVINHHEAEDMTPERGCLPTSGGYRGPAQPFTSVEVFQIQGMELRLLQRLAHPEILSNGNDLVARPNGDVFVTAPPRDSLSRVAELLLGWSRSKLVRYKCERKTSDGLRCYGRFEVVAEGFGRYFNGIAITDTEPEALWVASTLEERLYTIPLHALEAREAREAGTGVADEAWEGVPAPFGLDNLEPHPNGQALLGAAHPRLRRFFHHAFSERSASPSQIWRLPTENAPELLFADSGRMLSAASVALPHQGSVLIGQVFEERVLRCTGANDIRAEQGEPNREHPSGQALAKHHTASRPQTGREAEPRGKS